jgi:WD40 repeat protein
MFGLFPGECVNNLTGHTGVLWTLTLFSNGLLASGSSDTKIMIWDITKTSPLYTRTGHTSPIRALYVINQDYLASGGYDGTIKLWSLTSNYTQVRSWQASSSNVLSLAFDSTLNVLVSGENVPTNYVKVWDSNLWAYSGKFFSI